MKEIPLTQGYVALVDDEDYQRIVDIGPWCASVYRRKDGSVLKIYAHHSSYTVDKKVGKGYLMHRVVLGLTDYKVKVDHFPDPSGVNNQRSNLRLATAAQNTQNQQLRLENTSGYKGVHWSKHASRWTAAIKVKGKTKRLGYFTNPKDAARTYDKAALEFFNNFACTNEGMGLL